MRHRDAGAICAQLHPAAIEGKVVHILLQHTLAARVRGEAKVQRLEVLELDGLVHSCFAALAQNALFACSTSTGNPSEPAHTVLHPIHQALRVGVFAWHQEFDVEAYTLKPSAWVH